MEHRRLPKAVREDPMSWRAWDPSGSSKAKEIEETWPSLKVLGSQTQEGGCRIVRLA